MDGPPPTKLSPRRKMGDNRPTARVKLDRPGLDFPGRVPIRTDVTPAAIPDSTRAFPAAGRRPRSGWRHAEAKRGPWHGLHARPPSSAARCLPEMEIGRA